MANKRQDQGFEYRVLEWRDYEKEGVATKMQELRKLGWEPDGEEQVKAGMFTDLYFQSFKRRK